MKKICNKNRVNYQDSQINVLKMELFSTMPSLDQKDLDILSLLKKDARMTTGKMSKILNIPQTTIHNRIKRMRDDGVIRRFTIVADRKKIGRGLVAYILCTISYRTGSSHRIDQYEVARQIDAFPEVERVSIVTGEIDLIVRIALPDVDALNEFVISKLRNIDGIERTVTSVVLSEIDDNA